MELMKVDEQSQSDAVAGPDDHPIISNRHGHLRVHMQRTLPQLMRHTGMVRALEKAWAERRVHLHRSVNDLTANLIQGQ